MDRCRPDPSADLTPPYTRLKLWDALYWQDKKRQLAQLASRSVWDTLYPFFF